LNISGIAGPPPLSGAEGGFILENEGPSTGRRPLPYRERKPCAGKRPFHGGKKKLLPDH